MSVNIQLKKGVTTIIDYDDYDEVIKHKWCVSSKDCGRAYSVQGRVNGKLVYLHRFLMNPPKDKVVDHIDRNPLNNQRSNLRICTRSDNQKNKIQKAKTSRYKGVCRPKKEPIISKPFLATIKINGKSKHLGCYATEEEAAMAYNEAAKFHHGEYAYLNII